MSIIIIPESSVEVKWHEGLVARVSDGAAAESGHSQLLVVYSVFLADEFAYHLTSPGMCCILITNKLVIITSCTFS